MFPEALFIVTRQSMCNDLACLTQAQGHKETLIASLYQYLFFWKRPGGNSC